LKYEVLDKMSALITAAFGLVAALAWNDAIKSLFAEGGPLYFMASYGIWGYAYPGHLDRRRRDYMGGKDGREGKKGGNDELMVKSKKFFIFPAFLLLIELIYLARSTVQTMS